MDEGQKKLDEAFEGLQREVPDSASRALRWLRSPGSRWARLPVGAFFIVCSFFWFLPVVGIEFLPVGLLLIAQDVPFLRKPVAHSTLWLERRWRRAKRHWKRRRAVRAAG